MPRLKTRVAMAIFRRYPALIRVRIATATGAYLVY
jgi:hypothetical protein